MQAALAVAELHDLAQHAHQHGGVVFLLAGLVRDHPHQPLLFGIEPDGVVDPLADHIGVKRAGDKVRSAHLVGLAGDIARGLAGDHDDRDVLDGVVAGHVLEHGKAIFHGDVDIQQHQRDIAQVLLQQLQAFFAIGCFQNAVIALQDLGEEGAVPLGIVHDQNLTFALLAQIPFPQGEGAGLQHDGILFGFCLVHQGIGTVDGLFQRVRRTLQHRTDAQRKVQMRVAGEGGLLFTRNRFRLLCNNFLRGGGKMGKRLQ